MQGRVGEVEELAGKWEIYAHSTNLDADPLEAAGIWMPLLYHHLVVPCEGTVELQPAASSQAPPSAERESTTHDEKPSDARADVEPAASLVGTVTLDIKAGELEIMWPLMVATDKMKLCDPDNSASELSVAADRKSGTVKVAKAYFEHASATTEAKASLELHDGSDVELPKLGFPAATFHEPGMSAATPWGRAEGLEELEEEEEEKDEEFDLELFIDNNLGSEASSGLTPSARPDDHPECDPRLLEDGAPPLVVRRGDLKLTIGWATLDDDTECEFEMSMTYLARKVPPLSS